MSSIGDINFSLVRLFWITERLTKPVAAGILLKLIRQMSRKNYLLYLPA
jgi:hypothetical protein